MKNKKVPFEFAEGKNLASLFIKDTRFEIECKPFLGNSAGLMACMWQMDGLKRIHLYSIQYGQTKKEIELKMTEVINNYNNT